MLCTWNENSFVSQLYFHKEGEGGSKNEKGGEGERRKKKREREKKKYRLIVKVRNRDPSVALFPHIHLGVIHVSSRKFNFLHIRRSSYWQFSLASAV